MSSQVDAPCDWRHVPNTNTYVCRNCQYPASYPSIVAMRGSFYAPGCPAYVPQTPAPTTQAKGHNWYTPPQAPGIPAFDQCFDCHDVYFHTQAFTRPMGPCFSAQVQGLAPPPEVVVTWAPSPAASEACYSCGRELCDFLDATYDKEKKGLCVKCQRNPPADAPDLFERW